MTDRERLAQPQRTHWEGCEEVHPECRKQQELVTFDQWWATLTPQEHSLIGVNNARFVWQQAFEVCAQIAETAEPYQAADLIRAKGQK